MTIERRQVPISNSLPQETAQTVANTNRELTKLVDQINSTVATRTGTETLTNKTLTSPTINTPTINTATINTPTITTPTIASPTVTGGVAHTGVTYANRPASPTAGMTIYVTNSNTAIWGATIAGGGANKVLAFYNGTNWTVAGI